MKSDNGTGRVRPTLRLLGPEQIQAVHRYSLDILETTGIRVESPEAVSIFRRSGGVTVRDGVVFIHQGLVGHALETAPSSVEIFDRRGETAFVLGRGQTGGTRFGIGVTNTGFQEIATNRVRPFTRADTRHAASLAGLLPDFDMISTPGIPSDADPVRLDLLSALDLYANTIKPLVLLIADDRNTDRVFELLGFMHGDISRRPFCIPYVNPVTPLVMNASTTAKMISSIRNGLPLMYSNYGMYGGTTPATEAGTLALLNAELLAGLVFSQLVREGSGIILGSLPAAFNMQSMGSSYTPATYLLNLACAEMMDHYGIPHCGTSGSNAGWGPDLQASAGLWLNHLTSCLGRVGCAPFVGGNFDSMAFSPATVVLSGQIIREARKFADGFMLDDAAAGLDEIHLTGHGGNYLTSVQTLESLSRLNPAGSVWPPLSLEKWQEQGMPQSGDLLAAHTLDIYSGAIKASQENNDRIAIGEAYIDKMNF